MIDCQGDATNVIAFDKNILTATGNLTINRKEVTYSIQDTNGSVDRGSWKVTTVFFNGATTTHQLTINGVRKVAAMDIERIRRMLLSSIRNLDVKKSIKDMTITE